MPDIMGTELADELDGTGQDDTLFGLGGDDIIRGKRGNDKIDGGAGFDFIKFNGESITSGITIDMSAGTATDPFGSRDTFVNIEGVIATDFDDVVSGSERGETIRVGAGNDRVNALGGNDRIGAGEGNDQIDGGAGTDAVGINVNRADATIARDGSGHVTSVTSTQGIDSLVSIERIEFLDSTVAFDTGRGETAGSVYRVYQAAFARTPDNGGLKYWIDAADKGASLGAVAQGFINSAEFQQVYGTGVSNADYIGRLYRNVLGREGEQAGLDFWVSALERNQFDKAGVLAGFAESDENVALVGATIAQGIVMT